MRPRASERAARLAAAAIAAILAVPPMRRWLEADMARHMLLEFPLALALGAIASRAWRGPAQAFARLDRHGLTGWLAASLTLGFWMIPAALDAALANGAVEGAKLASLVIAGFVLGAAWRRSPPIVEAFFVGNLAWMTATVGLIYQEAESQLCLNYLADGQQRAGRGLVLLAIAGGIAWLFARRRALGVAPASGPISHARCKRAGRDVQ